MRITIERDETPQILHTANPMFTCDQMVETDEYIFVSEGVCTEGTIIPEEAIREIEGKGIEHLQRKYKGVWVVAYYDKRNRNLYVCNDLLSKKVIFYYNSQSLIIIDTSFFDLCSVLREKRITPQINQTAIQQICGRGVLEGDITYEKNTKWLFPYISLKVDLNAFVMAEPALPIPAMKTQSDQDKATALRTIEDLFTKACRRQWDLNQKYGKDQIATLSGGMDSRATVYHMMNFAREEGTKVYAYTYAQSGSLDEDISKELAKCFGVEYDFIPLDDCSFVWQRERIIRNNEGQTHYVGTTGAVLMADKMREKNKPFVVHTGVGGGYILGDAYKTEYDDQIFKLGSLTMTGNQWRNLSDLRVCPAFHWATSDTCFALSPFLDEDFFEYCMCLPTVWKVGRRLYDEWYHAYMDMGADLGIANIRNQIGNQSWLDIFVGKVIRKLTKLTHQKTKYDMNPFSYWYARNKNVKKYFEEHYLKETTALKKAGVSTEFFQQHWKNDFLIREKVLTATYACLMVLGIYE